jgi:hypothetical protein
MKSYNNIIIPNILNFTAIDNDDYIVKESDLRIVFKNLTKDVTCEIIDIQHKIISIVNLPSNQDFKINLIIPSGKIFYDTQTNEMIISRGHFEEFFLIDNIYYKKL